MNDQLRQRTEDLDHSNTFRESILSSLGVAVVVLNDKLQVLMWNNKAKELWGLDSEEVQGKPFVSLDIGLPVDQLMKPLRACLAGKAGYEEMVVKATNRKGKPILCRVSCSPLSSKSTQYRGLLILMEEQAENKSKA